MRARAMRLIILAGALLLVTLARHLLVAPPAVDPDHPFDTARVMESLTRVLGDDLPHMIDSDQSDIVIERWLREIRDAGFTPEVDDAFHCNVSWGTVCGRVRNIGFWVGAPGDNAIMLASHHDSVAAGPGAADDGMGVAASIEIARHYAEHDRPRPIYVLITDGEEIGLLGASRFVAHSPVAPRIGAVISLEARGNRGTATMFETSRPNGRDVHSLHPSGTLRPLSNSMAADIYEMMPNGSDVTEYLALPIDAANFSMIGRYAHYHSPQDTVANLSPRSVFHVGASAMGAVEGFMAVGANGAEGSKIYSDTLRRGVVTLPSWTRWPVLGLALVLCGAAALRQSEGRWRALIAPPIMLAAGIAAAIVAAIVIAAIRPEASYGLSHPWALRGLYCTAALLAAFAVARWLYRPSGRRAALPGAWVWVIAIGLIAAKLLPGASIMFVVPGGFAAIGAMWMLAGRGRAGGWFFAAATVVFLLLTQPLIPLAEDALFIEVSAPFVLFTLIALITALPLIWHKPGGSRPVIAGLAIATLGFGIAAALVPAYTAEHPQNVTLVHFAGDGIDGSHYRIDRDRGEPLPDAMTETAPFAKSDAEGASWPLRVASAPPMRRDAVETEIMETGNETQDGISIRLRSSDTDRLGLRLLLREEGENISYADDSLARIMSVGGFALPDDGAQRISCMGRSCRDITLIVTPIPDTTLRIDDIAYGLEPQSTALLNTRPVEATPRQWGDRRTLRRYVPLPSE